MSVFVALLQALVLFAAAPLLSGITRVARARLHNRRGPGVLQEYRDIIKLLGRQSIGPDASGWVFRLMPYVMVGVMLTIATALPVVTVDSPMAGLGDLITLIYLFAIARFFFAIAGLDTGSPFTAIGASREAMLGVLVEPILLLGLWVAAQVAGSTHISSITDTVYHWPAARQHSAAPRAGRLRFCHLYRNGQAAVRPCRGGAGAAGRAADRIQRQRFRGAEMGD
nr:formate hydrogenlyase subunit 4 [Raoultella sp. NCTC 9187]